MNKIHKIQVCARVNLYLSNKGFIFLHATKRKPKQIDLYSWNDWGYHYPPYLKDNLVQKVYAFCDSLTEREKMGAMYQGLTFDPKWGY